MLIRCPTCSSTYDLPAELLRAQGRMVRCADCRECWVVATDPASERDGNVLSLFGPEIVAEARSGRRASAGRTPPGPHPRARLAGSLRRARGAMAVVSLGLVTLVTMAGLARRSDVVRLMPPTAPLFAALGLPVNLRGLALDKVTSQVSEAAAGGSPVLTLEGEISNLRGGTTEVPRLKFSLRDKASNELYSWTAAAPKPRLHAGETIAFRSRLAAPPAEGRALVVSFAD